MRLIQYTEMDGPTPTDDGSIENMGIPMGDYFYCRECGGYTRFDEERDEIIEDTCECRCIQKEELKTHLESCERCTQYLTELFTSE